MFLFKKNSNEEQEKQVSQVHEEMPVDRKDIVSQAGNEYSFCHRMIHQY